MQFRSVSKKVFYTIKVLGKVPLHHLAAPAGVAQRTPRILGWPLHHNS